MDRFDLSAAEDANSAVDSVYQFLVSIVLERYKIVNEQRHHNEVLNIFRIRVWRCYRKYKGGNVRVPEHVAQSLKAGSMLMGKFKKTENDPELENVAEITEKLKTRNSLGNPHPATVTLQSEDSKENLLSQNSEKSGNSGNTDKKYELVSRRSSVMRLLGSLSRFVLQTRQYKYVYSGQFQELQ